MIFRILFLQKEKVRKQRIKKMNLKRNLNLKLIWSFCTSFGEDFATPVNWSDNSCQRSHIHGGFNPKDPKIKEILHSIRRWKCGITPNWKSKSKNSTKSPQGTLHQRVKNHLQKDQGREKKSVQKLRGRTKNGVWI